MLELRIVIALSVREIDFVADYPHLPEGERLERHSVCGDRAYQIFAGTAKPKDGMPGRVYFRSSTIGA